MEKKQQAVIKVKRDCPICEQCQSSSIRTRPDGSYRCNQCGYDSVKGKK
jgi:ribosomal protein L37AE/L43A